MAYNFYANNDICLEKASKEYLVLVASAGTNSGNGRNGGTAIGPGSAFCTFLLDQRGMALRVRLDNKRNIERLRRSRQLQHGPMFSIVEAILAA